MAVAFLWAMSRRWVRRRERWAPAAAGGSGDEDVAGLVDGGRDVGPVDRLRRGDGDRAAGQVDVDGLDAGDCRDLLGHRALAVGAGHAGDGEGGGAEKG